MTGFGVGEHRDEKRQLSMTLKSYNNRFLDLFVYLPPGLSVLEPQVRRYLSERVLRGRVELSLKYVELQEAPRASLDRSAVRAYAQLLRELAREAGVRGRLRLSDLLRLEGVIRTEPGSDPQELWPVLEGLLARTFAGFDEARAREGEATQKDVLAILAAFEQQMAATGAHVWPDFRFVVQETYPPYQLAVVSLAPSALALADAKVKRALAMWKECLATDRWDGYPDEIAYIEAPAWAEAQWLEREGHELEEAAA